MDKDSKKWLVMAGAFILSLLLVWIMVRGTEGGKPIRTESTAQAHDLTLTNIEGLRTYVHGFGLLVPEGVVLLGETEFKTVARVLVRLVDSRDNSFWDEQAGAERVFAASKSQVEGNELQLSVFLAPDLFEKWGKEEFTRVVSVMTIRGLFLAGSKTRGLSSEDRESQLMEMKMIDFDAGGGLLEVFEKQK